VDIPPNRLTLYYTKNPCLFCCHTEIYKPLKDVIIEIAKRSKLYKQRDQLKKVLEDLSEEILRRKVCKRKVDSTINKNPKRFKV
jgi:deoxycytidylate deaminase